MCWSSPRNVLNNSEAVKGLAHMRFSTAPLDLRAALHPTIVAEDPERRQHAAGLFLNELRHIKRDVDPVLPTQGPVEPRHRLRNPVQLSPEQIIENARVPRGKAIKVDRLHLELALQR